MSGNRNRFNDPAGFTSIASDTQKPKGRVTDELLATAKKKPSDGRRPKKADASKGK